MLPEVLPGEVPSSHFFLTFHPFFPAWDLVQRPAPPQPTSLALITQRFFRVLHRLLSHGPEPPEMVMALP